MNSKLFISLSLLFSLFLHSCKQSDGVIEYRNVEPKCIDIPVEMPGADTTIFISEFEKNRYEERYLIKSKNLDYLKNIKIKIEDSIKSMYLVNESSKKRITFTVKYIYSGKHNKTFTKTIKLNPGEEYFLGCNYVLTDLLDLVNQSCEIVGHF